MGFCLLFLLLDLVGSILAFNIMIIRRTWHLPANVVIASFCMITEHYDWVV